MTASLFWVPVAAQTRNFASGSRYHKALTKAFGEFPTRLTQKDIPILRGMAAVDGNFGSSNPYEKLVHALTKHNVVEVSVEY